MRENLASVALFLLIGLVGTPASAQTDNAAAVESLFADGKKLMAAGKTAEACPKFLASYNLEQRVGTLLNLADCYEKNGQVASAWARYIEVRTLATRANQPERAAFASERVSALEPRRSMLTIVVGHPTAGLVVRRDGVVVDPVVYGVAVPVDGGPHTVEASAPDAKPVTATVTVGAEGDNKTYALTLPALDAAPSAAGGATQRWIAIGAGVAGLVGLGIGAGFGASASSSWSQSQSDCASATNCPNHAQAVSEHDSAGNAATISTIGLTAGGVLLAGGVILFFTAPHGHGEQTTVVRVVPSVGRDSGGMWLTGSF